MAVLALSLLTAIGLCPQWVYTFSPEVAEACHRPDLGDCRGGLGHLAGVAAKEQAR